MLLTSMLSTDQTYKSHNFFLIYSPSPQSGGRKLSQHSRCQAAFHSFSTMLPQAGGRKLLALSKMDLIVSTSLVPDWRERSSS